MGWLSDLLGVGAQTALGYGNLAYQMQRDSGLTGAEREANAFSAQQAEIARDWQEKFYNQYESPQAMIRQAQEAGINPAAIFGNAMGGSAPSSSAPTSVIPKGGDVGGAVAQLAALSKQIAEIDLIKSQTHESQSRISVNEAQVGLIEGQITKAAADVDYIEQQIKESGSRVKVNEVEAALKAFQTTLTQYQAESFRLENFYQSWRNNFIEEHGITPEIQQQRRSAWTQVAGMGLNALINQAGGFLTSKYGSRVGSSAGERTVETINPNTGEIKSILREVFNQATK